MMKAESNLNDLCPLTEWWLPQNSIIFPIFVKEHIHRRNKIRHDHVPFRILCIKLLIIPGPQTLMQVISHGKYYRSY